MKYMLNGKFGFINKPVYTLPNEIFWPKELVVKAIYSNNLFIVGNNNKMIAGGGISFNEEEAEISALGEYVERYSSSFQNPEGLLYGSYNELNNYYTCYNPSHISYYSDRQYFNPDFELNNINNETKIHWKKGCNYLTDEEIWLPFFMTNTENIKGDGLFHINTSTGTAAHNSLENSIKSGLLECIERDAFAKFWYFQKFMKYKKYSSDFLLRTYPKSQRIHSLFDNRKVKIIVFDISNIAYCPTYVTFIFFKKKNTIYQSIGSASRTDAKEAVIKSCLEAYQGIPYVEKVCNECKDDICSSEIKAYNFKGINSFKKHFALYNIYPNLIKHVPILNEALNCKSFDVEWKSEYPHHIQSLEKEELLLKGLNEIYYTLLTTQDVSQLGFEVIKVITPKLHLLTGNFNYPYLGLFKKNLDLFTEFPHPFP